LTARAEDEVVTARRRRRAEIVGRKAAAKGNLNNQSLKIALYQKPSRVATHLFFIILNRPIKKFAETKESDFSWTELRL
jgi:hypothetical protein